MLDGPRFVSLVALLVCVVVITYDACHKVLAPPDPPEAGQTRAPLHYRTICPASGSCVRVGIPAGECATTSGVTICVGPDAGSLSPP